MRAQALQLPTWTAINLENDPVSRSHWEMGATNRGEKSIIFSIHLDVTKMDGENNGKKSLLKWDDLGIPLFLETSIFRFQKYKFCRYIQNPRKPSSLAEFFQEWFLTSQGFNIRIHTS